MLATQLVEEVEVKKVLIPAFIPHSNRIPTKEEIEEFDANNQKMANQLAKEDKTKRVNKEELKDRGNLRLSMERISKFQNSLRVSNIVDSNIYFVTTNVREVPRYQTKQQHSHYKFFRGSKQYKGDYN